MRHRCQLLSSSAGKAAPGPGTGTPVIQLHVWRRAEAPTDLSSGETVTHDGAFLGIALLSTVGQDDSKEGIASISPGDR